MKETVQAAGAARREQILEAAAQVFAVQGFHAATVRDVARAAGVADGTIYNHFENKTALLLGLFNLMAQRAQQEIDPVALAGLELRDFVRLALLHPLRALGEHNFELFRVVVSEILVNRELAGRFLAQISGPMQGTAGRVFGLWAQRNGVPPERLELLTRTISGLVLGLIVQRLMGDTLLAERWDTLPDQLADLLVDGLAGARA